MTEKITITNEQIKLGKKLTSLQRKFVINIVSTGMSQRQAYVKAGGRAKTKESQDTAASNTLSIVKVRAFHDSLVESTISKAIMTREEILENLSDIGRTIITDIVEFDSKVQIKSSIDIEPKHARAISEISNNFEGLKVKIHSSPQAMKQITEMNGWNAPRETKITGQLDITAIRRKIIKANDHPSD